MDGPSEYSEWLPHVTSPLNMEHQSKMSSAHFLLSDSKSCKFL